jgi:hypothetical protein
LEGVHFDGVKSPWRDYGGKSTGEIGWKELKFSGGSNQPTYMPNEFPVFEFSYTYKLDNVEEVQKIVTDSNKGAGNVIVEVSATVSPKPLFDTPHVQWNDFPAGNDRVLLFDFSGRLIGSTALSDYTGKITDNRFPSSVFIVKQPLSNNRYQTRLKINR